MTVGTVRSKESLRAEKAWKELGHPPRGQEGNFVSRNLLVFLMSSSVVAGLALGFLSRQAEGAWTRKQISYLGFPGEMFRRVSEITVLPMTTFMMIGAVGRCSSTFVRRLFSRALIFHLATKVLAVGTAFLVGSILYPGIRTENLDPPPPITTIIPSMTIVDGILDLFRNLVPESFAGAYIFTTYTSIEMNTTNREQNATVETAPVTIRMADLSNDMGVIFFCFLLGMILNMVHSKENILLRLCIEFGNTLLTLNKFLVWYYPVGICFKLASQTLRATQFVTLMYQLRNYFMCVSIALGIHGLITMPIILLLSRKKYRAFYSGIALPLITAFGTSSSNACMGTTISMMEDKMGINSRIVKIIVPMFATINKDGTAIYTVANVLFCVRRHNRVVHIWQILCITMITILTTSSVSALPHTTTLPILSNMRFLGLPFENLGYFTVTDWILDRLVTMVNIMGDAVCCSVLERFCKRDLINQLEEERAIALSMPTTILMSGQQVYEMMSKTAEELMRIGSSPP